MRSIRASNMAPAYESNAIGALWALCGVGLFALIYVSGKLSGTEAGALQIMWLRYVGGFLTMAAVFACGTGAVRRLSSSRLALHACRAGAGGFGGVAAVYAASNMPVASATAIGLLDGLFTVCLGMLLLREHVGLRQWLATLICLTGAGAVVASQGAFSASLRNAEFVLPALAALAGAILVAGENILIKTLVHRESAITVLFYVNLFGAILLAGPAMANWALIEMKWMGGFLLLGPVAIGAQYCNIRAFRATTASIVGTLRYAWIIYGAIFGLLFFGEPFTFSMAAGIGLILLGGGWLATLRNKRR